jgi:hypothetical protein
MNSLPRNRKEVKRKMEDCANKADGVVLDGANRTFYRLFHVSISLTRVKEIDERKRA